MSVHNEDELAFAGVIGQLEALASGAVTAVELVELVLGRIDRFNPSLNAFTVVLADRARAEALAADRERAAGELRPLLGLPIAVKDDSDVAGVRTSHGSDSYSTVAETDSTVVARLRAAGAIIVGKTALPEFGQWPFTESTAFGITRNPWDVERTPGGSSGGSAAAVAAGMVAAATGSDGGGSIRIPAACCGLFGLKAQRGRISSQPYRDLWHGLGTFGVLTRDVAGAALLYDVIGGTTAADLRRAEPMPVSFQEAAAAAPAQALRIRVVTRPGIPGVRLAAPQREAIDSVTRALTELGHRVIEDDARLPIPTPALLPRMSAGVRDDLRDSDRPAAAERRTVAWARLGALLRGPIRAAGEAYARRAERSVDALFEDCDVLLTPTIAELPRTAGALTGAGLLAVAWRSMPSIAYTAIFNVTGHPAASIPAGHEQDGLPLAVQLVAPSHREDRIVGLAAQLERATSWTARRPNLSA